MEFKTTLEIVTKDIQDIEKLVSNFKNYSRIPNIELDLALSRLRNVYDLLLMFKSDNDDAKDASHSHKPTPNTLAETTAKDKPDGFPDTLSVQAENVKPVTERVRKDTSTPPPVAAERPIVKKKTVEEKKFINEKLGEQTIKKDVSSKLQGPAIKTIAGSLGINDKFLFIRELFGGNADTFRLTMNELDEVHNFNEAYSLLMDRFHWDMDSEPVQMLLNLIRRKFITSGNE